MSERWWCDRYGLKPWVYLVGVVLVGLVLVCAAVAATLGAIR